MKRGGQSSRNPGAELTEKKARALAILRALKKLFPNPRMQLNYSNNWELLVAVVLSAQCTDKKVNEVTASLFKKYRKFDDYLKAKPREFENNIKPTGFLFSKGDKRRDYGIAPDNILGRTGSKRRLCTAIPFSG